MIDKCYFALNLKAMVAKSDDDKYLEYLHILLLRMTRNH